MRRYLFTTLHPNVYHGHGKKPPFFEGWYYKLIDASENQRYAIIPGVFLSQTPELQHAFIQVLDGLNGTASYHTFPFEQFEASKETFDVRIGPNHFTENAITLKIDDAQGKLNGTLQFEGITPWPVTLTSPGIMGWYGWLPFMECYHGVVSLDHTLRGSLNINGEDVSFEGGKGYIEKDWGKSFPSGYIWMQSNHFSQAGTSFTASVAMIPSVGRTFRGFIIGLWHRKRLYRFATYTGAVIEHLEINDTLIRWIVHDRKYILEIEAAQAAGGLLMGPSKTEMHRRVNETLRATITVTLYDNHNRQGIFAETGRSAGLEAHGDLDRLLNMR